MNAEELNWNRTLREQWEFHRDRQVRTRIGVRSDRARDLYPHMKTATNGATR